jgi:serine/threonine-protein kinase HipA
MISDQASEAFVWCWLPEETEPVPAGRVWAEGDILNFNYGQSYLGRENTISLYLPELPLESGAISPLSGLTVPGCIADAMPDAWGQRVVMQHLIGSAAETTDPAELGILTYLLESGSDRIGALDFQRSPDTYVKRENGSAPLEELMEAADRVIEGLPLTPDLDRALLHGSSIGGARPKALLDDKGRKLIAKFSSASDSFAIVKGEYAAMELARRADLDVAPVEIVRVMGKDVLLVERFDRLMGSDQRRPIVSALTILELSEAAARYASYADLAQIIRERFTRARETLRELFARITFNILVGNTDDHARNHAAFWDGEVLTLTPAYDICPQDRAGGETAQLMAIARNGWRMSQVAGCVAAADTYLLDDAEAREIVDHQIAVIESEWDEVSEIAQMTEVQKAYFWHRQFLNPYATEDYVQRAS